MYLYSSSDNTLNDNNCSNNENGIILSLSDNNTLTNNTCDSNGYQGIDIDSSSSNTLGNNTCLDNVAGISLYWSTNNTLVNNNCSDGNYGLHLQQYSRNNTLSHNDCLNDIWGLYLERSSNNTVINNNCSENGEGLDLAILSNNNTFVGNTWSNNDWGISFGSGDISYNTFTGNTISCSTEFGFAMTYSENANNRIWNNTFYHNNGAGDTFEPMHIQAQDSGANNWWNSTDGYGNYWSDWTGPDVNGDGIVDAPYVLDGGVDNYPRTTTPSEPIPEFGMMPIVVIALLVAIASTIGARRRKTR
jgi:parallel beta-helix repeat protein